MKTTHQRNTLILIMAICTMVFSLFSAGIALADDDQPPVEPNGVEEPVIVPTSDESDSLIISEVFGQLPEDTGVMVLNEAGQIQPLVSQSAAEIVISGDPIWCPATLSTPTPNANGCTSSYTSFQDLLNYLDANDPR